MKLSYLPVNFQIKFVSLVKVDNNPLFVLRSVFGKHLRQMCCVAPQTACSACIYNKGCAYGSVFESIVEKKNHALPGRNTISHPYCVAQTNFLVVKNNCISIFNFTITLFGKAIDYLPYIYTAFLHAGKEGLFKERIPFEIIDVQVQGKSIQTDGNNLQVDFTVPIFDLCQENSVSGRELLVELKTPLRFKVNGSYKKSFTSQDFWACLYRRARTMFLAYGQDCSIEDFPSLPETATTIVDKFLHWQDIAHYSARQKKTMELGGLVGSVRFSGAVSNFEIRLLEFAKIANAGKNTNFGLGQIDYWMR